MDRVVAAPIIGRWPESHAATTHGATAAVSSDLADPSAATGSTPPAHDPSPVAASHEGLVLVGAIGGLTVGSGLGTLVGWPGTTVAVAAIVGLDVGLLLGTAVGALRTRLASSGSPD
jgi:hypothetical protein